MPASIQSASFAALAFALVLAWPARAEVVNLKATMDANSEVPPNSSPATGTLTATYDTGSKKLSWKGSYSGLSGPATAAHFHSGEGVRMGR
jgi:CHRD domain-containing protein